MATHEHGLHYRHHSGQTYPISMTQRLYTTFIAPFAIIGILIVALAYFSANSLSAVSLGNSASFNYLFEATIATFFRMCTAYVFAVLLAFPLAILVSRVKFLERLLIPVFDVAQSIPVLVFFPVVIVAFATRGLWNEAAIFIIFLSMLWNIIFSLISGFKAIPRDIEWAAEVFRIKGFAYFKKVLLPASVPSFVLGSLLAWAQGWNIIIVAEVLHVYLPHADTSHDLFGIGRVLVDATSTSNFSLFLGAMSMMVCTIALLDFLVWQKLLRYAERFKFD